MVNFRDTQSSRSLSSSNLEKLNTKGLAKSKFEEGVNKKREKLREIDILLITLQPHFSSSYS